MYPHEVVYVYKVYTHHAYAHEMHAHEMYATPPCRVEAKSAKEFGCGKAALQHSILGTSLSRREAEEAGVGGRYP